MSFSIKKRKIKYIRENNFYRLWDMAFSSFVISEQIMMKHSAIGRHIVKKQSEKELGKINTKFKIIFSLVDINMILKSLV